MKKLTVLFLLAFTLMFTACENFNVSDDVINNITGTLNGKSYSVVCSEDYKKVNTLYLYEENGKIYQKLDKNTHKRVGNIFIEKSEVSKLCSRLGVKSVKDLYTQYGPLLWKSEKFYVLGGMSNDDDMLLIFDTETEAKTEIVKQDKEEYITAREDDGRIRIFTTKHIYTYENGNLTMSEYKFSSDFEAGEFDYDEIYIKNYIIEENFSIYAHHAYVFADSGEYEKNCTYFYMCSNESDSWQVEKYEDITVLDYYTENGDFYIVYAEDGISSQINIEQYSLHQGIWQIKDKYVIDLMTEVEHQQYNFISKTGENIVYYPKNKERTRQHIFIIDKNIYKVTFTANTAPADIGLILDIK